MRVWRGAEESETREVVVRGVFGREPIAETAETEPGRAVNAEANVPDRADVNVPDRARSECIEEVSCDDNGTLTLAGLAFAPTGLSNPPVSLSSLEAGTSILF
jgi:hypothetical protein